MVKAKEPSLEGTILAVRKPPGISSFGVVSRIRQACRVRRVGHAGTLDPFAEGVLVIGIGRAATRQLGPIVRCEKEYIAEVVLGISTDTGDPTGRIISLNPVPLPDAERVIQAFRPFIGEVEQIPPLYSAVKIGGERAYRLARRGETPERSPRTVTIREIQLLRMTEEGFVMRVVCGHGTYIRTLAEDIGKELGGDAHLRSLLRTRVGEFTLEGAETLDDLLHRLHGEASAG